MSVRDRLSALAREVGLGAAALLRALLDVVAYPFRRAHRLPAPRVVSGGPLEVLALLALVMGLVAAAMILVDPLVTGIRLRMPGDAIAFFERVTDLGLGGVVLWPLGLALLYVLALSSALDGMGRRVAASIAARLGFLFFSIAAAGLLSTTIKRLIGRARPYAAASISGPDAQFTFDVLAWKSSFASFPSGHSTTVFATAVAFGALFPRARKGLFALAVLVGFSRIALGSHYPSDVIAGAAFGSAIVLLMVRFLAARRVVFAVGADGQVRPKAGPSARRLGTLFPISKTVTVAAQPAPRPLQEARS